MTSTPVIANTTLSDFENTIMVLSHPDFHDDSIKMSNELLESYKALFMIGFANPQPNIASQYDYSVLMYNVWGTNLTARLGPNELQITEMVLASLLTSPDTIINAARPFSTANRLVEHVQNYEKDTFLSEYFRVAAKLAIKTMSKFDPNEFQFINPSEENSNFVNSYLNVAIQNRTTTLNKVPHLLLKWKHVPELEPYITKFFNEYAVEIIADNELLYNLRLPELFIDALTKLGLEDKREKIQEIFDTLLRLEHLTELEKGLKSYGVELPQQSI